MTAKYQSEAEVEAYYDGENDGENNDGYHPPSDPVLRQAYKDGYAAGKARLEANAS